MADLKKYIKRFRDKRIMVIGDMIADEFIIGQPERMSREAPVLILRHQNRHILPGGGANAGNNICSLGGKVYLVGVIGQDSPGDDLRSLMKNQGIDTNGLIEDKKRPTSLKTRVLAGGEQIVKQQVVRIDHLETSFIDEKIESKLLSYVKQMSTEVDGILLSDYGNGVFTDRVKKEIIEIGCKHNIFVAVDSRYNLLDYKKATIATPNLEEAGYALDKVLKTQEEVIEAGQELIKLMELQYLLITQGGDGMTLFTAQGDYEHIPVANFSEVFDVTGAGDTVVGTLILAFKSGAKPVEAIRLANYAAGIVVRKSGVATVTPEELEMEVLENEQ